jgi:hypothetical protein
MNNNIRSQQSLRAGIKLGMIVLLITATAVASSRPSFPSDEVFYSQTQDDTVNIEMTNEEEKTIR